MEMKKYFALISLFVVVTCVALADMRTLTSDSLKQGFDNPPQEAKPLTWWHWINGSVSKEGIEKDFKSFKEAGIAGVQLLNANMYVPAGHLRFHSQDWFDYIKYAIEKANKYGLEFTIMNCDGWATAGGPWNTPETSMKKFVWSETDVVGGSEIFIPLPKPSGIKHDFYRDIEVFAVPAYTKENDNCKISVSKKDDSFTISFDYFEPLDKKLFSFGFTKQSGKSKVSGVLYASDDGKDFRKIGDFLLEGYLRNMAVNQPFKQTKAKHFKVELSLDSISKDFLDTKKFSLTNDAMLSSITSKTMSSKSLNDSLYDGVSLEAQTQNAIRENDLIFLTSKLDVEGNIKATLPKGKWTIIRLGYTTTGSTNHPAQKEGHGLEVDKMNSKAVLRHLENSLARTIQESRQYIGATFKGILFDSWEAGEQNWTESIQQDFRDLNGYDMKRYLPVLTGRVVDSQVISNVFLMDFRRTISTNIATKYYATARKFANDNGLIMYAEPYAGDCFNEMQAGQNVDVIMSEFWVGLEGDLREGFKYPGIKKTSSTSHMTGRTITGAESFTARELAARWSKTPIGIKDSGDLAFVRGLNRAIFHTSAHQPNDLKPGFSLGRYGTHFGRANTWWHEAKIWMDYMSRTQFMLQSGKPYADILYLRSDDVESVKKFEAPELPLGYDFECANSDMIKNSVVSAGKIVIPNLGYTFSAFMTPKYWEADLVLLKKIKTMAEAGVLILGTPPAGPNNMADAVDNYSEWQAYKNLIWKNKEIYPSAAEIEATLAKSKVKKDFEFAALNKEIKNPLDFAIRAIHRKFGFNDIYFVANLNAHAETFEAKFKVTGKTPQLWNSVTGEVTDILAAYSDKEFTYVDMNLPALGSVFVVFKEGALDAKKPQHICDENDKTLGASSDTYEYVSGKGVIAFKEGMRSKSAKGVSDFTLHGKPDIQVLNPKSWQVNFTSPFRERFERSFNKLELWNKSQDAAVKYFSGTALYRCEFELSEDSIKDAVKCVIDLGKVYEIARVKLNSTDLGVAWTYPYEFDASKAIKSGKNILEIYITNSWVNRMIADEKLPQDTKYDTTGASFIAGRLKEFPSWYDNKELTAKRQRKTWAIWKCFDGTEEPVASGLEGPITIKSAVLADSFGE